MDHLVLVRNMHGVGQNLGDPGGLIDGLGLAADLAGEAAAGKVFERQIREAVLLANLEDLDDVRVFDRGDRLRFCLEANQVVGPGAGAGPDHLQSDKSVEPLLACLVDDSHSARAEHLENLVAGDPRPRADRAICRQGRCTPGIIG